MKEDREDIEHLSQKLLDWFRPFSSCLVAFSGGLDSSVLAKAASEALGEKAVAAMAWSASTFYGETEEAEQTAAWIPIRLVLFKSGEADDPDYLRNDSQRCYYCKRIRFRELTEYARRKGLEIVVDGSNRDDADDYRPGRRAVEELGIRSPLAELGLDKPAIRRLAEFWELSNRGKAASSCLSTRLAYGVPITERRLRAVEEAEAALRLLGMDPVRVRLHPDRLVRIELPPDQWARFAEPALRQEIAELFKNLGFAFVSLDLEAFRSGSMNVMLEEKR